MKKTLSACLALLSCLFMTSNVSADQWASPFWSSESDGNYEVFGEYLYWQVLQDNMDFAQVLQTNVSDITKTPIVLQETARIKDQNFKWKSGFKLGAGYTAPCCAWDAKLIWTSLCHKNNTGINTTNNSVLPLSNTLTALISAASAVANDETPHLAASATSHWKFDFNTLDFQIGKPVSFGDCFVFRPFVGVKGAWINQKQHVEFFGLDFITDDDVTLPLAVATHKKNDFSGVGPSFGFDSSWEFLPSWKLNGCLSLAYVYGKFKLHATPSVLDAEGNFFSLTARSNKFRFSPTADARIGLSWNTCLCESWLVDFGIGYEVQYWWDQWRAAETTQAQFVVGDVTRGNLMLHGLFVHAGIGF